MARRNLAGRLERLEQYQAALSDAGRVRSPEEWQAVDERAAAAAAICGDDITGALRRFGDAPVSQLKATLQTLSDRELLLLGLVLHGMPIEPPQGRHIFGEETTGRLNAALAEEGGRADASAQ